MARFQETEQAASSLEQIITKLTTTVNELAASLVKLDSSTKTTATSQNDLKTKTTANKTATEQLTKAQKAEAEILRLATAEGKKEIDAQVKLTQARKLAREEAQKNQGVVKKSGGLFKSMTKSILAAGAAMLSFRAALLVVKNTFKTITEFESGMSKVRAITGATVKEFKSLQGNALLLGATTSKTASEVAGLQVEFAKLGFTTADILSATEATIQLSIAAGTDLSEAAVVAASTIRGFGLSTVETQRVVDVMAKSFSSSALDIEKFKVIMATVAPVAKASGKSLEFATAQAAVLADAGLDASTAGTSLRNMFLELNRQGLTWEQGLEKINGSTNKNITALDLFGKRGATAGLILAENTLKAGELEASLNGAAGSAEEMARIMEDNFIGDVNKAKSAWEGFILNLKDTSAIRGAVQAITALVGALNEMVQGADVTQQKEFAKIWKDRVKTLRETNNAQGILNNLQQTYNKLDAQQIADMKDAETARGQRKRDLEETIKTRELSAIGLVAQIDLIKNEVKEVEKAELAKQESIKQSEANILEERKKAESDRLKELAKLRKKELDNSVKETIKSANELSKEVNKEADASSQRTLNIVSSFTDDLEAEIDAQVESEYKSVTDNIDNMTEAEIAGYEDRIEALKEFNEKKKELNSEIDTAIQTIATDQFNANIDDKLNTFTEAEEARQEVLKDRLDKGTISEAEYERKLKASKLKVRIEEAKAEKKKALFDIGVATAVAAVRAMPKWPIVALVLAIGAVQAAAVASKPLPKYEDGEVNIKGKRHSQGGINANIEDGESVINRMGTKNAYNLLTSINKGLIKDSDVFLPTSNKMFSGADTAELVQQFNSNINLEPLINEQKLTRKAIEGQPKYITTLSNKGLEVAFESKGIKQTYINKYLR